MFIYSCYFYFHLFVVFFFKKKTAYDMRISDWCSDVCSSDLIRRIFLDGLNTVQARRLGLIAFTGKNSLPVAGIQPESELTSFVFIDLKFSGHEYAPFVQENCCPWYDKGQARISDSDDRQCCSE